MTPLKLAQGLTNELLDVIHKYDDSMPLVSVLGVLEIVKQQLIQEHTDTGSDE